MMDGEQNLVVKARSGDQMAFGELVRAYQNSVYNLCYRMLGTPGEAEEATQETFLRIYRHLNTYDNTQKLSSWILAIASHYCVDRLRRRRIQWLSLDEPTVSEKPAAPVEAPEAVLLQGESQAEVQEMLSFLPESYRVVITLRYWEDLSYEEIAGTLRTSESAVKSRLHRARELLAERISERRTAHNKPVARPRLAPMAQAMAAA